MQVAEYLMQRVAELGVRHVFLVVGGGAMHLNHALAREPRLTPVCNAHEQASAMAAEAYAKVTGNLGVCMVTTGPGGTNAVTGVAGAWLDSTPTLFLSGQVKRSDRIYDAAGRSRGVRQMGNQEIDIVSIVRPITKYAVTVLDPLMIRHELEKALALAREGRPGPVWLDLPLDVQSAQIPEPASLQGFDAACVAKTNAREKLQRQVGRFLEKLCGAQRPLLLVGNGVRLAGAERQLEAWRARWPMPTVATWCARDLVADENYVGSPGTVAPRGANFALQNCDLLLVLGARLDAALTAYAPEHLARGAHKTVIDVDPAELAKLAPHVQQPVEADAGAFLDALLPASAACVPDACSDWKNRCAAWMRRYPVVTEEHRRPAGAVSVYALAEAIAAEAAPEDLLVSGSSGAGVETFLLAFPVRKGQRIYHTAGLGAMGYGLPMALGVALGGGARRTILVDGDGGFQFNIQELETLARLHLPVKCFVLNNDGYSSIRGSQRNYFGRPEIGCDRETGVTVPALDRLAAAFGMAAVTIADQGALRAQVRAALDLEGPVLIDVHVRREEPRLPRVASYQKADGSMASKPLEEMEPALPREEFLANMIVAPLQQSCV